MNGVPTPRLAQLHAVTGDRIDWAPRPDGLPYVVIAPPGTIFAGGSIQTVGGVARRNLASLDATTGAIGRFNSEVDDTVRVLTRLGNTIFAGGPFDTVDGQARQGLAAFGIDGTLQATAFPPVIGGSVETIAIDGDRIYIGGRFGSVNGNPRSRIAALDLAGNVVPTWNAAVRTVGFPLDPSLDEARVTSIAITPSNIFVAGTFTEVQSISAGQDATRRNRLAAFTKDNASVRNWNPNPNGEIHALRTSGTTLHVIGTFSSITGGDGVVRARRSYARFNNNVAVQPVSLLPTANAGADPAAFTAIALRGDTTILAGPFSRIGAEARTGLAIIDDTGSLLPFRATPGLSLVTAITANNTTIFTADDGRFVNGQLRFLRAYDNAGTLLP